MDSAHLESDRTKETTPDFIAVNGLNFTCPELFISFIYIPFTLFLHGEQ